MSEEADEEFLCENCGACLNDQIGFNPNCCEWTCMECGCINQISDEADEDWKDEMPASNIVGGPNPQAELDLTQFMKDLDK